MATMQVSVGSVELGRARREAGRPLVAREAAVAALLARGLGIAQAADELGIAPEHVRETLRGAMVTLEARSKIETLILALRAGLIGPAERSARAADLEPRARLSG